MISAVITNYNPLEDKLYEAFLSLQQQVDEVVIISSKKTWLGQKINKGLLMTIGDYIIISNDDAVYLSGDLNDLCITDAITCPYINGADIDFHAHVFCVPRKIFEVTGGYDESYEQAYYDDWDFWKQVEADGFNRKVIPTVNFSHPPSGGTTLHRIDDMEGFRERNRQRYNDKWGAMV